MGIILDSSILVKAEREGNNAHQMLAEVSTRLGNTEIAVSVIKYGPRSFSHAVIKERHAQDRLSPDTRRR
jgi:predicted nucleic acid-binding protein